MEGKQGRWAWGGALVTLTGWKRGGRVACLSQVTLKTSDFVISINHRIRGGEFNALTALCLRWVIQDVLMLPQKMTGVTVHWKIAKQVLKTQTNEER